MYCNMSQLMYALDRTVFCYFVSDSFLRMGRTTPLSAENCTDLLSGVWLQRRRRRRRPDNVYCFRLDVFMFTQGRVSGFGTVASDSNELKRCQAADRTVVQSEATGKPQNRPHSELSKNT